MIFMMGIMLGVLLTVAAVRWRERKPKDEPTPPPTRQQRQLWHEYQNFLSYTGDEQAEFEE